MFFNCMNSVAFCENLSDWLSTKIQNACSPLKGKHCVWYLRAIKTDLTMNKLILPETFVIHTSKWRKMKPMFCGEKGWTFTSNGGETSEVSSQSLWRLKDIRGPLVELEENLLLWFLYCILFIHSFVCYHLNNYSFISFVNNVLS